MAYTFTHTDPNGVEVTVRVPERSPDEMCEYFQRFLSACGYIFDEGERIQSVKDQPDYPGCAGDILSFDVDGSPFVYDFGDGNNMNCYGGVKPYSGVRGGMAEDIINFGASRAAMDFGVGSSSSSQDIISFS